MSYLSINVRGMNIRSPFLTNGPFADEKRRGHKVTWGATIQQWENLRRDLRAGTKPHKAVTAFMCKVGLNPDNERTKFANGWKSVFPRDTISGMRAQNKSERYYA